MFAPSQGCNIDIINSLWVKVAQSCPALCHSMDSSPPGSSVHRILQARILEWVTMPSSRGSSQPRSPAMQADSLPSESPGKPSFNSLDTRRLPWPSLSPGACSNSCPLSQWCHPTISSSIVPFSSCLQSFPASRSFPVSQLFMSGGQSIEASA